MSATNADADFGARLRQAREARGISLREIAASTKISMVALEGLERNDLSRLPGGLFSRAFVRSYAREVGLDPEGTVRDFLRTFDEDAVADGTPAALRPPKDTAESSFEARQRVASTALKLVLISVPMGILLVYLSTRGAWVVPEPPASGQPEAVQRRATPPPVVRDPAEEGIRAAPASAPAQLQPPAVAVTAPAGGSISLEVTPTAACWVSLTVDGSLVIARVMEAGERVVRRVRTEAVVQVGDAGAFTFLVNGRPGRPLGDAGQVRTLRITPDNFQSFLR